MLIDTHCHIQEADYPLEINKVIERAHYAKVMQIICVGTSVKDSRLALELAEKHKNVFVSIGIHPHHAYEKVVDLEGIAELLYSMEPLQPEFNKAPGPLLDAARSRSMNKRSQQDVPTNIKRKLVAIGEIGLDYHYSNNPSSKQQIKILKQQIKLALKHDLPIIFHVRDAYDDFWKVLDSIKSDKPIRGVLHSFTDTIENAKEGLKRGLYISVNGISTFTHDHLQKEMFNAIPLNRLLLETDAPWLTPYPLRGKIKTNEPAYVREIAEYISKSRDVSFEEIASTTTANARNLFKL